MGPQAVRFQSTLPARGATILATGSKRRWKPFQSTLPARGATVRFRAAEGHPRHFNPHSPRGERPFMKFVGMVDSAFQSTLPARGATFQSSGIFLTILVFQSTLPARGATWSMFDYVPNSETFQSTLPARGATRPGRSWLLQV